MNQHDSDTFTCSVDGVSSCSRAPVSDVFMDSRLWNSIVGLCGRFNTEWMAYLIGSKREDGDYEITHLSFPDQRAGSAHVRNEVSPDFTTPAGTVGVVHSHVRMQAFFSPTDKAHANWPVEIVVNAKGEYETSIRVQLPCGEHMRKSSRVILKTGGVMEGMEAILKDALEKGKAKEEKERSGSVSVVWSSGDHGYGFGHLNGGHAGSDAFRAARQGEELRLFGGKYSKCPICQMPAQGPGCCGHSLKEMEDHEESQKGVAP